MDYRNFIFTNLTIISLTGCALESNPESALATSAASRFDTAKTYTADVRADITCEMHTTKDPHTIYYQYGKTDSVKLTLQPTGTGANKYASPAKLRSGAVVTHTMALATPAFNQKATLHLASERSGNTNSMRAEDALFVGEGSVEDLQLLSPVKLCSSPSEIDRSDTLQTVSIAHFKGETSVQYLSIKYAYSIHNVAIMKGSDCDIQQKWDITCTLGDWKEPGLPPVASDTLTVAVNMQEVMDTLKEPDVYVRAPETYTVTASIPLNVRSAPSGEIIGYLNWGEVVSVTEKSGDWFHVKTANIDGWSHSLYLQKVRAMVVVPPEGLNLRASANTEAAVYGLMPQDDKVLELSQENGWSYVRRAANDQEGWCKTEFLTPFSE